MELTKKERIKLPQQEMPTQSASERIKNIEEVPLGYTPEMAIAEAKRCLQCGPNAPCIKDCPVGINIPGFMAEVAKGNFAEGVKILKSSNLLPGVCGRVCPQEIQCQKNCTLGKILKDPSKSVSIGNVERFLADWERENIKEQEEINITLNGKKVGVVGSGPAGLTAAGELARTGYEVHVYEALHSPGGVLAYGIPEFRLPKVIVRDEVRNLERIGVHFHYNFVVGKTMTMEEMIEQYDAIFVGSGAGLPSFLGIPGENLLGTYSANEYLTRCNLMKAFDENSSTPILRGDKVVVVGGGNVAMDSARTALRLGAKEVKLVYRRSEAELPARAEELEHAKEEGLRLCLLENPVEIIGDEKGWVTGVRVVKMKLGEPDASGRRRPIPIEGSEFVEDADIVVIAIGNSPNPLIPASYPAIETNRWGCIVADEATGKTSVEGIFAAGDIVLGAATVIKAMGYAKDAAKSIDAYLKEKRDN